MSNLLCKLGVFVAALTFTATSRAAPIDDYKAFGSIAALSEQCLNSSQISARINIVVPAAIKKNPALRPVMDTLIQAYNAAYTKAMVDGQIWEASSSGTYGFTRPVNCRNPEDVKAIRSFHDSILEALN
jgi:hypothetical protein